MSMSTLRRRYDDEKMARFKLVSRIAMGYYSLPLYMLFWLADWCYVPQLKWEFLALRALIFPSSLLANHFITNATNRRSTEAACSIITIANALPIVTMIVMIGDVKTPYYAGLMMVAAGMGNFFPWTMGFFWLQMALIFVPYYAVYLLMMGPGEIAPLVLYSFFIVGILVIATVIRFFGERLVVREFFQRVSRERSQTLGPRLQSSYRMLYRT